MARNKRFIDEASAAALVRYGPELSVLKELMSSTRSAYRQKVHSAAAGASAIEASSARALEQLKGIYPEAIGGIPGLSRVQALNDMAGRGVAAHESAAGARRTALAELAADRAKIAGRRSDIAQEIGAFTTSEAGKLGRESAQRDLSNRISLRSTRQSERSSVRSSGIDPDTGQPIPGGKLDPKAKKPKLQTTAAHAKVQTAITDAQDVALPLAKRAIKERGPKAARGYVDYLLRTGVDEKAVREPVYEADPNTGVQRKKLNPDGTPVYRSSPAVKIPKVPATVRGAVLDIIFDGHISARHMRALQRSRFSIEQLGLPTKRRPGRPLVPLPKYATTPMRDSGPRVA